METKVVLSRDVLVWLKTRRGQDSSSDEKQEGSRAAVVRPESMVCKRGIFHWELTRQ